jgi:hypothetical protein
MLHNRSVARGLCRQYFKRRASVLRAFTGGNQDARAAVLEGDSDGAWGLVTPWIFERAERRVDILEQLAEISLGESVC